MGKEHTSNRLASSSRSLTSALPSVPPSFSPNTSYHFFSMLSARPSKSARLRAGDVRTCATMRLVLVVRGLAAVKWSPVEASWAWKMTCTKKDGVVKRVLCRLVMAVASDCLCCAVSG